MIVTCTDLVLVLSLDKRRHSVAGGNIQFGLFLGDCVVERSIGLAAVCASALLGVASAIVSCGSTQVDFRQPRHSVCRRTLGSLSAHRAVVAITPANAGCICEEMLLRNPITVHCRLFRKWHRLVTTRVPVRSWGSGAFVFGGIHKEGVACVQGREVVKGTSFLSLLPLLAVRVLLAADNDGIDGNQDRQDAGQDGLHDNQSQTSHRLGSLVNTKLFNEYQNADDGNHTNDLNHNVDPVSRLERERAEPELDDEEERLDDELTGGLGQTMTICASNDAATSEHVDDERNEDPPVALLVVLVEDAVLDRKSVV